MADIDWSPLWKSFLKDAVTMNSADGQQYCFIADLDANDIAYRKAEAYGKIQIARMIADEIETDMRGPYGHRE